RGDNGPAALASLSNPRGVAVGADGSVYIGDTNNHKVRKVTAGVITAILGAGTAGNTTDVPGPPVLATAARINAPGCVAVDPSNNVYVADRLNSKIRKVDSTGKMTTGGNTP